MKLTKDQRHTAYIILLAELERSNVFLDGIWLCNLFYEVTDMPATEEILPELFQFRPNQIHWSGGWWDGYDIKVRKKVIKQCIEETYNF